LLTIVVVILIIVALGGGGYAFSTGGPAWGGGIGLSGILLVLLLVWLLAGHGRL
jgi:hypothetical protein